MQLSLLHVKDIMKSRNGNPVKTHAKNVSSGRIQFETRQDDSFYDPINQVYILKSVKEIREGKGKQHELIEDIDE